MERKMSSEGLKTKERTYLEKFFGHDLKMVSGNYFTFTRIKSEEEFILLTNDIKYIKEKPVLIIAPDKGVYLFPDQVKQVSNYQMGINTYAVVLKKKYFKPWTFKFTFSGYEESREYTYEELLEIAREQQTENIKIRVGWPK